MRSSSSCPPESAARLPSTDSHLLWESDRSGRSAPGESRRAGRGCGVGPAGGRARASPAGRARNPWAGRPARKARPSNQRAAWSADGSASEPPIPAASSRARSRRFHMPRCSAPEVACAPDFQVAQRNLEAGASVGELLDGLEPPTALGVTGLSASEQQVSVGPVLVASHPAAKLVQSARPYLSHRQSGSCSRSECPGRTG